MGRAVGGAAVPTAPVPLNTHSLKMENKSKDTVVTSATNSPSVWGQPPPTSSQTQPQSISQPSSDNDSSPSKPRLLPPSAASVSGGGTAANASTASGSAKPAPWAKSGASGDANASDASSNNRATTAAAKPVPKRWAVDDDDEEDESEEERRPASSEQWPSDFRESVDISGGDHRERADRVDHRERPDRPPSLRYQNIPTGNVHRRETERERPPARNHPGGYDEGSSIQQRPRTRAPYDHDSNQSNTQLRRGPSSNPGISVNTSYHLSRSAVYKPGPPAIANSLGYDDRGRGGEEGDNRDYKPRSRSTSEDFTPHRFGFGHGGSSHGGPPMGYNRFESPNTGLGAGRVKGNEDSIDPSAIEAARQEVELLESQKRRSSGSQSEEPPHGFEGGPYQGGGRGWNPRDRDRDYPPSNDNYRRGAAAWDGPRFRPDEERRRDMPSRYGPPNHVPREEDGRFGGRESQPFTRGPYPPRHMLGEEREGNNARSGHSLQNDTRKGPEVWERAKPPPPPSSSAPVDEHPAESKQSSVNQLHGSVSVLQHPRAEDPTLRRRVPHPDEPSDSGEKGGKSYVSLFPEGKHSSEVDHEESSSHSPPTSDSTAREPSSINAIPPASSPSTSRPRMLYDHKSSQMVDPHVLTSSASHRNPPSNSTSRGEKESKDSVTSAGGNPTASHTRRAPPKETESASNAHRDDTGRWTKILPPPQSHPIRRGSEDLTKEEGRVEENAPTSTAGGAAETDGTQVHRKRRSSEEEKIRLEQEAQRKEARNRERAQRGPRTKGVLYRYNEHGDIERVITEAEKSQHVSNSVNEAPSTTHKEHSEHKVIPPPTKSEEAQENSSAVSTISSAEKDVKETRAETVKQSTMVSSEGSEGLSTATTPHSSNVLSQPATASPAKTAWSAPQTTLAAVSATTSTFTAPPGMSQGPVVTSAVASSPATGKIDVISEEKKSASHTNLEKDAEKKTEVVSSEEIAQPATTSLPHRLLS
eukprot:scaffold1345_cov173-Ochromonas_danica.AAC.5